MTEDEAAAPQALVDGGDFAAMCAALEARGGDATSVASLLRQWIEEGLLARPAGSV